jgi:hypothetical protein
VTRAKGSSSCLRWTATRDRQGLNINIKTVEAHRLNIMRKLRLTSLSQLVRYAIREGIIAG